MAQSYLGLTLVDLANCCHKAWAAGVAESPMVLQASITNAEPWRPSTGSTNLQNLHHCQQADGKGGSEDGWCRLGQGVGWAREGGAKWDAERRDVRRGGSSTNSTHWILFPLFRGALPLSSRWTWYLQDTACSFLCVATLVHAGWRIGLGSCAEC